MKRVQKKCSIIKYVLNDIRVFPFLLLRILSHLITILYRLSVFANGPDFAKILACAKHLCGAIDTADSNAVISVTSISKILFSIKFSTDLWVQPRWVGLAKGGKIS